MPSEHNPVAILEFEASIECFLALGREIQKARPLTAEHALQQLVDWYRSIRIRGSELDRDGDMLLLQWGETRPLKFTEPTDLRRFDNIDMTFFEPASYRYIDLTRQVFAPTDREAEFDDEAVQMSISLLYEPGSDNQRGSNIWIPTPANIESGLQKFHSVPFVKERRVEPSMRAVVSVSHCG
jgi:hypothetical protein